jgi:acyl-CoA thioester hydrolase
MRGARGRGEQVDVARMVHWTRVEVRYSDLDVQGHVNNATFFTYFEQARVAYFADLRGHLDEARRAHAPAGDAAWTANAATPDLPFVIASASCAYKRPIAGLAPVYVGVRCAEVSRAAITMHYAICDAPGGTVYATGATLTVSVDLATGRPRALPVWVTAALARAANGAGAEAI